MTSARVGYYISFDHFVAYLVLNILRPVVESVHNQRWFGVRSGNRIFCAVTGIAATVRSVTAVTAITGTTAVGALRAKRGPIGEDNTPGLIHVVHGMAVVAKAISKRSRRRDRSEFC